MAVKKKSKNKEVDVKVNTDVVSDEEEDEETTNVDTESDEEDMEEETDVDPEEDEDEGHQETAADVVVDTGNPHKSVKVLVLQSISTQFLIGNTLQAPITEGETIRVSHQVAVHLAERGYVSIV